MWLYLLFSIFAVVGFNLVLFAILQHTARGSPILHLRRRIQHSITGLVILTLYYFADKETIGLIALLSSLCFLAFDYYRRKLNPDFNEYFINYLGWLLRTPEYYDRPVGATFYLLGVATVMTLTRLEKIVYISVLNLSLCDPVASLVGSAVKSPQISQNKTLAGSLSGALVGVLVAMVYSAVSGVSVNLLVAGVIALVSELVVVPGVDDNLTIPAVSCVLWKLYSQDMNY